MSEEQKPIEKEVPPFPGIQEFIFNVPLYSEYKFADDLEDVKILYGQNRGRLRHDGHCPYCEQQSTFTIHPINLTNVTEQVNLQERFRFEIFYITCARSDAHVVKIWFRIKNLAIQKVGQYPSLADVANDESKKYKSVLKGENSSEFHKAIGLAAHGVGIGSFVYLRRIFERLIAEHFQANQAANKWDATEFAKLRMEEKVLFLKTYLPEFLVTNRKIYSILSLGIHELTEKDCLTYFNILKKSIVVILDDDQKKREELQMREEFEKAIQNFKPPTA